MPEGDLIVSTTDCGFGGGTPGSGRTKFQEDAYNVDKALGEIAVSAAAGCFGAGVPGKTAYS